MLDFRSRTPVAPEPSGDNYRLAASLLAEFGDRADLEVARRGDAALEDGNVLGSARWGRIGRALDELMRSESRPGDGRA